MNFKVLLLLGVLKLSTFSKITKHVFNHVDDDMKSICLFISLR